ncbi:phosphoribosylformylglycinamidine synthase subunit PurQ [Atrimonas thermophila]|uniref:phosphoribosylformylglycinamidine synthase subunit PurQ n=1 Tax=Atrimonas thermophila TaxID=3064161 RepID=UPI00399C8515
MRFGIVVFPGSNCDRDCFHVLHDVLGVETVYLWHATRDLKDCDCIVLPGGFSYGDYLRAGAIAAYAPIMLSIREFAEKGGLVLGICNGFQILVEAGLLPGVLLPNVGGHFICRWVYLRVENSDTPFTMRYAQGEVVKMPIAHQQGNFFVPPSVFEELERNNLIAFRYCDAQGRISPDANPNGSVGNIAGIVSPSGNVLGMMPHPERCAESILGSEDGKRLFQSIIQWLEERKCSKVVIKK